MRIEPPPSVPIASAPMPAASAAARRMREVPRISRDPGQRRITERLPAVFRRRRLAEKDGAVLAQPGDRRRILVPRLIALGQPRAAQGRPALGQHDVLDRRRHAVDETAWLPLRPARLRLARRRERPLDIDEDESIELGLQAFEPRERRIGRLDRRERLAAIGLDQRIRRHETEFAIARHGSPLLGFMRNYPGKVPAPQPPVALQSPPVAARCIIPSRARAPARGEGNKASHWFGDMQ